MQLQSRVGGASPARRCSLVSCDAAQSHFITYLANALRSFNDNASFPDLTVKLTGHKTWLCHKMVLCKRSDWFLKACSGKFKEGGASLIEVKEGDGNVLEAALEYCYTLGGDNFETRANEGGIGAAVYYVRLFHVAEFYFIKGLAGLAADGFGEAISASDISTEQIVEAFEEAYNTTVDPEKLLRKAIINKTLSNKKLYLGSCPEFSKLILAVPEFAQDMLKAMVEEHPAKVSESKAVERNYHCRYCSYRFRAAETEPIKHCMQSGYPISCDGCGKVLRKGDLELR